MLKRMLAVTMIGAGGAFAQDVTPAVQPSNEPAVTPISSEPVVNAEDPDARKKRTEALLDDIEKADRAIKTLTAKVVYEKRFDLGGDTQTRWGRMIYTDDKMPDAERKRRFAVHFDRLRVGSRLEEERRSYLFDGVWFIEKRHNDSEISKWRMVREGEKIDPLRIGEGRMPIAIGQRKEDILARFMVESLDAEDGLATPEGEDDAPYALLRTHAAGTVQIKLVPIAGTEESRDLREVRLWYRKIEGATDGVTYLPVLAREVNRSLDVSTVRLGDVVANGEFDAADLDTTDPEGWKIDIRDLKGNALSAE